MSRQENKQLHLQAARPSCLKTMMAGQQLSSTQIVDNMVAAAFGNASLGPSAAKAFQHLAAAGEAAHPHPPVWPSMPGCVYAQ